MVEARWKSRGGDIVKPGNNKEGRVEGELNTYYPKGDYLRVPVEIWDRGSIAYEG